MIIALIILGLALLITAIREDSEGFLLASLTVLAPLTLTIIITTAFHAENLAKLRKYDVYIKSQSERLTELKSQLQDLNKYPSGAFIEPANAALVESITEATLDLTKARSEKAMAEVGVEKLKAGMFWFIPSIYGEK